MLGDVFNVQGLYRLHLGMTVLMCATWTVLFTLTVLAFWRGLIFYSKDEDVIKDMRGYDDEEKFIIVCHTETSSIVSHV